MDMNMKIFHGPSKAKDSFVAKEANANIYCQGNSLSLVISLADNFWKRFCGLMFRKSFPGGWGLLLTHCNSVHTMFMRFPIDVIYLDNNGKIVKCIEHLKPWRFSFGGPEAVHCLELVFSQGLLGRLDRYASSTQARTALRGGISR